MPSLQVRKKNMCRMRTNPAALVLRVTDLGEREALLQGDPDVFFSTPHYDGYPYVLVRLEAVDPVELAELLEDAWRVFAAKRVVAAWDADGRVRAPRGRGVANVSPRAAIATARPPDRRAAMRSGTADAG